MSVTVGIISHNLGEYLPYAIESAARQADRVVLLDDGSTDGSIEIAEQMGLTDVYFNNVPSGSAVWGWNQLIDCCRTDWLIPLSADDVLLPDACSRLEACTESDWVYGDLDIINAGGQVTDYYAYAQFPHTVPLCIGRMWMSKTLFPTMIAGFRTSFLKSHNLRAWSFPETQAFMDTPTGASWLACWPRLKYVGKPLAQYRVHPQGETFTAADDRTIRHHP